MLPSDGLHQSSTGDLGFGRFFAYHTVMSEIRRVLQMVCAVLLSACGPTERSSASPVLRRIILFNDDGGKSVGLMKDPDALRVFFNMMKSSSDQQPPERSSRRLK